MLESFEATVQRHQNRIYTFARYFLHDREEAEDVTQEVLLRLWRHRRTVAPERAGAWLTKVTRNACYDVLRRRRSAAAAGAGEAEPETVEAAPAVAPGPEAEARAGEIRRGVEAALAALDDPYRSLLVLREIQGLKYREIAEAMEMPLNTVRVYLHRGRKRLRKALEEMEIDAGH